ncbi:hypothetical protein [Frigoriflavimonas asaccharolytica]|uniref:DUF4410 domain-containing protein n=1 Tax=Frigoriflavimonas asaccharolytica TaxID=2735899 RepID=A0A8J8K530_9FLAO|nr:hypothetical protein [Frigoriflavimonas asaccharolytica]NRS92385.1 hypothetical protein [Frigoriflavimonas asaccharolytica]
MKKYLLIVVLSTFALNLNAQKQIFEAPDLKTKIQEQKTVAIIPFDVIITYKKIPKNFNKEANDAQEEKMSKSIQSSMYTFLLRKKDKYSVQFQDVDKTNILIKKAGLEDKLDETTKDELAKILGVDAVIGGKYEIEQTKSEAGAIATAVLLGGFGGKTGTGTLTLTINDGQSGDLLWRFFKTLDDNISTSTDDVVEHMMRKVSRNFPYGD